MRTKRAGAIMRAALGLCLAVLVSIGFAGAAHAQTTTTTAASNSDCLERFTNDGQLDVTGYAGCVQGATQTPGGASQGGTTTQNGTNLPATGADLSKVLVLGAVLVVLGGAAILGSVQARRTAPVVD